MINESWSRSTWDNVKDTVRGMLLLTLVVIAVCASCWGAYFLHDFALSEEYRKLAIDHQCGQYNPKTGDFEWIDAKPDLSIPLPTPSAIKAKR